MFEKLGRPGAKLAAGLVGMVGELCAGAEDAAEAGEDAEDTKLLVAAQNALGIAMRCLGPEAVLDALPLNLMEVSVQWYSLSACPLSFPECFRKVCRP